MLPNHELLHNTATAQHLLLEKCANFKDACQFIKALPYGRNSDRANWRLVLTERKGTCSTKHALLKSLADELKIPLNLTLGIFKMTTANTPEIQKILEQNKLPYIPEAHCYLTYEGQRFDFTRSQATPLNSGDLLLEVSIEVDDIGERKVELHKKFLQEHIGEVEHFKYLTLSKLWKIREQCIDVISSKNYG